MTSGPASDLANALLKTREIVQGINDLVTNGWTLERQGVALTLRSTGSDARSLSGPLSTLFPVITDARLSGQWSSHELQLEYVDGEFAVSDASPGDLRIAFEGTELDVAQDAWDGDAEAALNLAGLWTATVGVDPAQLLQSADKIHRWYVLPNLDAACSLFREHPWWELGGLLEPPMAVVMLVSNAPSDLDVQTARLRILSLAADAQWLAQSAAQIKLPTANATRLTERPTPDTPMPSTLAPTLGCEPTSNSDASMICAELWRSCAAVAWAWLATAVEFASEQSATLEFFGLQRTRHELPVNGPNIDIQRCQASYELWRWATSNDSPDQLLAARQVISLYRDAPPWGQADDIQRAAEPVFVALRSDATAEAFRMQREARALALTVARETADATIALAKGAAERCLASFAAIGGVIVAHTSRALTDSQASNLRLLIGIALLIMAGWSTLIEGPAVTIAARGLPTDISALGELLSPAQQQQALDLVTLKKARKQSWIVRIAVPAAYTAAAVVALSIH